MRRLAHDNRTIRADRRGRMANWMVIDLEKGIVVERNVDLGELGQRLGVLKAWERLQAE